MALGEKRALQREFWIETEALAKSPGNPFYELLNLLFAEAGFDKWVENLCAKFYADKGRPGIPPGVYFRMIMLGYFEGEASERKIAWRCQDSISLREFLGYPLTADTPDHSSMTRIRQRIDIETHKEVFAFILKMLAKDDLIDGKTVGYDATFLEANAALRSIVLRETGEKYHEYLKRLAKESGIETPTREDLAKLDRKRPKKGSNDDWAHEYDPDARIMKMKDGATDMAHKAEHAVDMKSGAILAVTLQCADLGDTTTIHNTIAEAAENMEQLQQDPETSDKIHPDWMDEGVLDKGYHSNDVLVTLAAQEIRTYISEPDRGRRKWAEKENGKEAQKAVYANRRRIKGNRGRALMRKRGELIERSFAHCYVTGDMRRVYLRGHENILKRLLIHAGAFNLGLILRKLTGYGTPKGLAEVIFATFVVLASMVNGTLKLIQSYWERLWRVLVFGIEIPGAYCAPYGL